MFAELCELCMDVTYRVGPYALDSATLPPPKFRSVSQALKALRADSGYCWLEKYLPKLMINVPRDDVFAEFRFIQDLATQLMILASARKGRNKQSEKRGAKVRPDKRRKKLQRDIDRVMQGLFRGVVKLTPDTCNVLLELLDIAKYELKLPRPKPHITRPELHAFAHQFLHKYNLLKTDLLLEAADAIGINCDERTAQRYIKDTSKA